MYRFVKITDTHSNLTHNWMLYCDSVEHLIEHTELYMNPEIALGINDYMQRSELHPITNWRKAVETLSRVSEKPAYEISTILENKVYQGKVKTLFNYKAILLRENGSYMAVTNSIQINEEKICKEMIYPFNSYSKEDIKITKWPGGRHFYAKIGKLDVVDKEGNVKWWSEEDAQENALKYLEKLNS